MSTDKTNTEKVVYSIDKQLGFSDHLLHKKQAYQRVCGRCAAIWANHSEGMTFYQKKRILRQHTIAAFYWANYDLTILKGNHYLGLCPADAQVRWFVVMAHMSRGMQHAAALVEPTTPVHLRPMLTDFCQHWARFVESARPRALLPNPSPVPQIIPYHHQKQQQ